MDSKPVNRSKERRGVLSALVLVAILVAAGFVVALGVISLTSAGSGLGVVTLGNQERQDITAPNQWVEGNIDFWLESHFYDAQVRLDAGTSPTKLPDNIDIGMSFFFSNNNAIVIDWTQDWHATFNQSVMYWSKTSAPAGAPFACGVPPSIVTIPVNGRSIQVPQAGSICINNVAANTTASNPVKGWVDLSALGLSDLNKVIPKRNEPCNSIVSGLCSSGAETETSPVTEHYFRLNLSAMFSSTGLYPQSWWPNLPAGQHLAFYFRNHLAMTSVWETAVGGAGGGSQPQFCISTPIGAKLNTIYNRCSWTTTSRFGAGFASGSKNHGDVIAPGIGDKTIPLPQVVAPTGFITVCKIVTPSATDQTGSLGTLTNGWFVGVTGPFGTSETKITGASSPGCAKFGPLFPASDYRVNETLQAGFKNIGTVVSPSADRNASFGANPSPSNPVNVSLTFSEAQSGSGPTVTFVNFKPLPSCTQACSLAIKDIHGNAVARNYAIAGDMVTITYTVTNTGNEAITVTQTHSNLARFGPSVIFSGTLAIGASHTETRTTTIVKADAGTTVSDTSSVTGSDAFGNPVSFPDQTCSVIVRAPNISFTKHPVAADNVFAVPGSKVTYTITVTNSGDAPATVTVSDALGAGQTLLDGGPNTLPGDAPSPPATSPAPGADYPAPTTIAWIGLGVMPTSTITLTFHVLVTTTVDGFQLTGTMTLTAANANGVDYTPSPNTANNLVTVTRPILKLSQFGYTNRPNGTPNQGVVNGTTVYTVTFQNFGTNESVLSGFLNVSVANGGSGTLACWAFTGPATLTGCSLHWSNVHVAPGATVTFTLTVSYRNMPTGAKIIADLTASYTTPSDGLSFIPSGTPARIEFTIQGG